MKKLRSRFERFCYRHRRIGIPNLMLYLVLGAAVVYLFSLSNDSNFLYEALCFDREAILRGQVWRLITYVLTFQNLNPILMLLLCYCYYSLGRALENIWGTLRFNLYLLCGVVMMDIYAMIFPCQADVSYLLMSLFLAYATTFPDAKFLFLYIIPIPAWVFGMVDLIIILLNVLILPFPYRFFPVIALANYFLFFGADILNILPLALRVKLTRSVKKKKGPKVVPMPSVAAQPQANYTHRCTVCGRTDVSDPGLEFRYCSRCKGYHCYCIDHISNHEHIQ